jgi:acetolactate synthase-1/2/3 large subunit
MVGLFTGGAAEADCVAAADLIILYGLDPVELILQPWPYKLPVVEIATHRHAVHYLTPEAAVYGALAPLTEALLTALPARSPGWRAAEIAGHKASMRQKLSYTGQGEGLTPVAVVEHALAVAGGFDPRITVDAGAHMFSAMAFWACHRPADVLISNGLATMAFALPAAIAAALQDPSRPVLAFTGDGGLMMCLGELATAAAVRARIRVVVFNDCQLSLIAIKQRQMNLPAEGVSWPDSDFAAVARGFGFTARRAGTVAEYRAALADAFAADGPALIDVRVDPSGYPEQLLALRG